MSNIKHLASAVRATNKRPFRVSIEGNIGSGKSTCIKYFDKYPNVEKHAVNEHNNAYEFHKFSSPTHLYLFLSNYV